MTQQAFDRVRSRAADDASVAPVDVQGKSSLFSRAVVAPSLGSVAITCSQCHTATVVSYGQAVKLALPSLHLPIVRREYPSWMRCPACGDRAWVRIRFH